MISMIKTSKTIAILIILVATVAGAGLLYSYSEMPEKDLNYTEYPLTITDDLGNVVTIKSEPQKIVSLAASNTEIIFAVGAGDKMVGRTDYCDYPEDALQIESMGNGWSSPFNTERIIELETDVVFSMDGLSGENDVLTKAGIPVIILKADDIKDVLNDISLVGLITNNTQNAENLVDNLNNRIDDVEQNLTATDDMLDVFYIMSDGLWTAGNNTFINDLITLSKGQNIASDIEGYTTMNMETIIERNPDIILIDSDAWGVSVDDILNDSTWSTINAVKNKHIYTITGNFTKPNPRIVNGLEEIAKIIHPECFEEVYNARYN